MKKKERKRMKILKEKYYKRMQKINDNYDILIKQIDNFRMKAVQEIGKLMNQDKELQNLLNESQKVWEKNHNKEHLK